MIEYDLDTAHSILVVHPTSALDKSDFSELTRAVDPQIEARGDLAGLIIEAPEFPGWDSFGTMVTHFRFIRDHHKHVKKVAIVTNSHTKLCDCTRVRAPMRTPFWISVNGPTKQSSPIAQP